MNRFQSSSAFHEDTTCQAQQGQRGEATSEYTAAAKHSLFVPLHYEKNYAYPLLVWLHGANDNERQLRRVMPSISLRNYVAVAPRGTSDDLSGAEGSYCWRQEDADIIEAQGRLTDAIQRVQSRYHIHDERIFIGGYADGGSMALRLALRMPHLFAGVISIAGTLPDNLAPLVNLERARGMNVLLLQGQSSCDYTTAQLCGDLRVLHAAGMSVAIRQYPAGDELTTKMLADVDSWVMERVTGLSSEPSHALCDHRERN